MRISVHYFKNWFAQPRRHEVFLLFLFNQHRSDLKGTFWQPIFSLVNVLRLKSFSVFTPARTLSISGLKSRVLFFSKFPEINQVYAHCLGIVSRHT